MNRKGFTLVELLGCLALLGVILCIGLYTTRGTLATSLSTLTDVSQNEIYDASKIYVVENKTTWTNINNEEYTCLPVMSLVDKGYFSYNDVVTYKNDYVRMVRDTDTKSINSVRLVDECE